MAKRVVTKIPGEGPSHEMCEAPLDNQAGTPRLERFLLDRFATTLEDPRTGRKIAARATEAQS